MGKKIRNIVLITLLVFILLILGGTWSLFGTEIKAMNTITELEEGLYYLEYEGDYGFDEFIREGGADSDEKMAAYITRFLSKGFYNVEDIEPDTIENGCSTLAAQNSDGQDIMGRNFDWEKCPTMIVHTKPDDGYESFSTCNISFLGFGENYKPEGIANKMLALACVYVPMDGMNEKGLVIADLVVGDKEGVHQDTDRPDVTTVSGLRLVLDHAADVDEAISLLQQYDMNASIGAAHHYSISDAKGNSVVIEYVEGNMIVTKTDIVTNHYLSECSKKGMGSEQSHLRYDMIAQKLEESKGEMSMEDVRDTLKEVSQGALGDEYEISCWSIVYNKDALNAYFYFEENYEKYYEIGLGVDKFIKEKQ